MVVKLRDVNLRVRGDHRVEKPGKDKPQDGKLTLHISNGKFSHSLLLRRAPFCSKHVIDAETFSFAEAHRGDGKRFIVRADEKLMAFMEPGSGDSQEEY